MKIKKQISILPKEVLINPFFLFSFSFIGAMLLYTLHWIDYPVLDNRTVIFFWGCILVSIVVGLITLPQNKRFVLNLNRSNELLLFRCFLCLVILIVLGAVVTFLYAGKVPLFEIFFSKEHYDYQTDFHAIKYFTVLVTSLNSTLITLFVFFYWQLRNCKYLYLLGVSVVIVVLFGSRGLLMISVFPAIFISLYYIKIKLYHLFFLIVLFLVAAYFFGVYGDIRESAKNRDHYSLYDKMHNERYPAWLPESYIWTYFYYTSPIVKFQYVTTDVENGAFEKDYKTLFFAEMIPYSICNAIYAEKEKKERASSWGLPSYCVGTAFDDTFLYGKWLGVIFYATYLFLFVGGIYWLAGRFFSSFVLPIRAVLCTISFFSVFDNMLSFSPIMFMLYWLLLIAFVMSRLFKK